MELKQYSEVHSSLISPCNVHLNKYYSHPLQQMSARVSVMRHVKKLKLMREGTYASSRRNKRPISVVN